MRPTQETIRQNIAKMALEAHTWRGAEKAADTLIEVLTKLVVDEFLAKHGVDLNSEEQADEATIEALFASVDAIASRLFPGSDCGSPDTPAS